MPSPFPGMDPYLESHWLDVHPRLIVEASNRIQNQLGDDLVARIEERLIVEDSTGGSRLIGPDVRVVEHGLPGAPVLPRSGVSVAEPLVFTVEAEPIAQRFIEILDVSTGGRVVSVIEIVSPTNKPAGDGRELYQLKQQECRSARVNLVEIDLTRAGRRELRPSLGKSPAVRQYVPGVRLASSMAITMRAVSNLSSGSAPEHTHSPAGCGRACCA